MLYLKKSGGTDATVILWKSTIMSPHILEAEEWPDLGAVYQEQLVRAALRKP